jgi:hypothetical protein
MLGRRVFSASGGLVAQSAYILFKDASLGLRAKTRPAHETQDAAASRDTAAHISRACTVVSSRIRDDVHLAGVHKLAAPYSSRRGPRARAQT